MLASTGWKHTSSWRGRASWADHLHQSKAHRLPSLRMPVRWHGLYVCLIQANPYKALSRWPSRSIASMSGRSGKSSRPVDVDNKETWKMKGKSTAHTPPSYEEWSTKCWGRKSPHASSESHSKASENMPFIGKVAGNWVLQHGSPAHIAHWQPKAYHQELSKPQHDKAASTGTIANWTSSQMYSKMVPGCFLECFLNVKFTYSAFDWDLNWANLLSIYLHIKSTAVRDILIGPGKHMPWPSSRANPGAKGLPSDAPRSEATLLPFLMSKLRPVHYLHAWG